MELIYLAIPYSGMMPSSFFQVTRAMAIILKENEVNVFSPITHCHPLKEYNMPGDWAFWEKIDYDFIDRCDGMYIVIPDEGVDTIDKSTGVKAEIEYAKRLGIPFKFIRYDYGSKTMIDVLPGTEGFDSLNVYM